MQYALFVYFARGHERLPRGIGNEAIFERQKSGLRACGQSPPGVLDLGTAATLDGYAVLTRMPGQRLRSVALPKTAACKLLRISVLEEDLESRPPVKAAAAWRSRWLYRLPQEPMPRPRPVPSPQPRRAAGS